MQYKKNQELLSSPQENIFLIRRQQMKSAILIGLLLSAFSFSAMAENSNPAAKILIQFSENGSVVEGESYVHVGGKDLIGDSCTIREKTLKAKSIKTLKSETEVIFGKAKAYGINLACFSMDNDRNVYYITLKLKDNPYKVDTATATIQASEVERCGGKVKVQANVDFWDSNYEDDQGNKKYYSVVKEVVSCL
jgi:hypothetical protein